MRILLLGKTGQVGWELQRTLASLGNITAPDRRELDLIDKAAISRTIRDLKPGLIVNAAAYTAVDMAEEEPETAMAINGTAVGIIAAEAALQNALLVHYSTDYVFDGRKKSPYTEQDIPNPINAYGKSKLAGEDLIRKSGCLYLILRTGWIYGLRGENFLLTIMRLAAENDKLNIVNDQHGSPTWCGLVAEITAQLLSKAGLKVAKPGLYHLTASGETTWYGFAREIIEVAAAKGLLDKKPGLEAIRTGQYPAKALRPPDARLSTSRLENEINITLPHWQKQLELVLEKYRLLIKRKGR